MSFKFSKKHLKVVKYLCIFMSLLFVLVLNIPIPLFYQSNALEIKLNDPTYLEERTVIISGYYNINLFSDDTFTGKIYVPFYKWTNYYLDELLITDYGFPMMYNITIDGGKQLSNVPKKQYYFGRIHTNILLRNACITVFSENEYSPNTLNLDGGSWNDTDGICIVSDANTRVEALNKLISHGIIEV